MSQQPKMDLDTDDEVLQALSIGKDMDYEQWPALFARLIPRLDRIVYEEFPLPKSTSNPSPTQSTQDAPASNDDNTTPTPTQSTDKENTPPTPSTTNTLPSALLDVLNSIKQTLTTLFSVAPPHTIQRLAELLLHPKQHYRTLPSYLHALDRVVHVTSSAKVFPLPPAVPDPSAANVLSNGTLPSGADPLSVSWANPTMNAAGAQGGLGSDESLGGALLTPITWLTKSHAVNGSGSGMHSPLEGEVKSESTEMVDGPNGPGGVETVSVSINGISSPRENPNSRNETSSTAIGTENTGAVLRAEGGVTQGELLRQEQRAGVVPAAQLQNHGQGGAGGRGDSDGMGEDDEMPHARGPEEIGVEDMGPQATAGSGTHRGGPGVLMQGIDVEAAVGRRVDGKDDERDAMDEDEDGDERDSASKSPNEGTGSEGRPRTPKREADEVTGGVGKRVKEDQAGDEDVLLVDADGKTEDEPKMGDKGETRGADAVDTSTIS